MSDLAIYVNIFTNDLKSVYDVVCYVKTCVSIYRGRFEYINYRSILKSGAVTVDLKSSTTITRTTTTTSLATGTRTTTTNSRDNNNGRISCSEQQQQQQLQ